VRLGYFKIEIYRMKKQKLEINNAVQSLYDKVFR
jgi:hypothetical protein